MTPSVLLMIVTTTLDVVVIYVHVLIRIAPCVVTIQISQIVSSIDYYYEPDKCCCCCNHFIKLLFYIVFNVSQSLSLLNSVKARYNHSMSRTQSTKDSQTTRFLSSLLIVIGHLLNERQPTSKACGNFFTFNGTSWFSCSKIQFANICR